MRADQYIGFHLLNTTAVSAIVSDRINYGLRPIGTALPCINYYDVGGPGRINGIERPVFSINCRASTAGSARTLADTVLDNLVGVDGTGQYGTVSGASAFSAARVSLVNDSGLIPEPDGTCYNVAVDVRVVSTL